MAEDELVSVDEGAVGVLQSAELISEVLYDGDLAFHTLGATKTPRGMRTVGCWFWFASLVVWNIFGRSCPALPLTIEMRDKHKLHAIVHAV